MIRIFQFYKSNSSDIKLSEETDKFFVYKDMKPKTMTKDNLVYKGSKPKIYVPKHTRINTSHKFTKVSDINNADFIIVEEKELYTQILRKLDISQLKLFVEKYMSNANECNICDDDEIYLIETWQSDVKEKLKPALLDEKKTFISKERVDNYYEEIINKDNVYSMSSFFEVLNEDGLIIDENIYTQLMAQVPKDSYYSKDWDMVFYTLCDCNIKKSFYWLCKFMEKHYRSMRDAYKGTNMSSRLKEFSIKLTDSENYWNNESFVRAMRNKYKIPMTDEQLIEYKEVAMCDIKRYTLSRLHETIDDDNYNRILKIFQQANKDFRDKESEK